MVFWFNILGVCFVSSLSKVPTFNLGQKNKTNKVKVSGGNNRRKEKSGRRREKFIKQSGKF